MEYAELDRLVRAGRISPPLGKARGGLLLNISIGELYMR